jgi:DNA-binding NtrC family response regulator
VPVHRHRESVVPRHDSMPAGAEERIPALLLTSDPYVASHYAVRLDADGYSVTNACDVRTALQLAKRLTPDVIFADARLAESRHLPDILARNPVLRRVPVVLLVPHTDGGSADMYCRAKQDGQTAFIAQLHAASGYASSGDHPWRLPEPA